MPRLLLCYLKKDKNQNQKPSFPLQASLEKESAHDDHRDNSIWGRMKRKSTTDAFTQPGDEQREQALTVTKMTSGSQRFGWRGWERVANTAP